MHKALLSTKLLIPPLAQALVLRPRLLERLDNGTSGRLTSVCAPAGYGKTTLLAHWIHRSGRQVAWLSLDPGDNDPQRFWAYVAAALERAGLHPAGRPLPEAGSDLETLITELLNALAGLEETLVLVLDDYHLIENPLIHAGLVHFLGHLPPGVRLVIASRSDATLPLASLRVARQVLELGERDLRFTRDEARALCTELMGLALGEDDLDILEARTEGWAAGLQLAALSLQYAADESPSTVIRSFSGGNRFVFDYLVEEVVRRQPPEIRQFLMRTSILRQMNASLCAAVTGCDDAQALLEGLERARLFIEPLDQTRGWYRYHTLFADSLQAYLQGSAGQEVVTELFRRAGQWFEDQGDTEQAVEYALLAGDHARAADLLEALSLKMFQKNMLHTLIGWLRALPDQVLDSNPSLRLHYALALTATWQAGRAEAYLRKIEGNLSVTAGDLTDEQVRALTPEARSLYANAAVMRCLLSMKTMDTARVIRIAEQTLAHMRASVWLDSEDDRIRAFSYTTMGVGLAHEYSGNPTAAGESYRRVIEATQGRGMRWVFITQWAWSHQGYVEAMQNRLHQAFATYRQEIDWALEHNMPASSLFGLTHVGLGELYYEWNDLDAAQSCFLQGIALGKKWNAWDSLWPGYFGLARLMHVRGNVSEAQRLLDELSALLLGQGMHVIIPAVEAFRAMLHLAQGSTEAAWHWAAGVEPEGTAAALIGEWQTLALVRVRLAQGRLDEAQAHLERLGLEVRARRRTRREIELLTLEARLLQARGRQGRALEALARALTLAEPEGYLRTFVDEGPPLAALVRKLASARAGAGPGPCYLAWLREVFETGQASPPVTEALIEPLTERESEVLTLIAHGLGYEEIGGRLEISINTVRTHVKAAYQKLGIHNRAQAAERARKLGLI